MSSEHGDKENSDIIELPAPSVWPLVAAFGITLLCAGLVTHIAVSVIGLILGLRGAVGWFRDNLPVEQVEMVPIRPEAERAEPIKVSPRTAVHLRPGEDEHRVRIPAEIHPYSSGVKGGLVGGVAMAIVACAYGLISQGSIWYPINLLAGSAMPSMANETVEGLRAFNLPAFIIGVISHGGISILVGVMFAVLLPMLPSRRAAFFGSLISPILWTALVWATLRLVNPALDAKINWYWFIASQVAFGLTCGYIVHHTKMVETMQSWPLAARMGFEAPGYLEEKEDEK
jgi:hypothetical protein